MVNQAGLLQSHFKTHRGNDGEARNDYWSISGNFIFRHHVEPRVQLYVPREASFPIPLNFFDVTRATSTLLDVMLEKSIDDNWNVDGGRELSDTWTGFTRFTILKEKPPDGYTWSRRRLTKNKRPSDQTLCGLRFGKICPMHRNAKRSKSGPPRNQSSIMPEGCVVFTSLILMMENSRIS